MSPRVRLALFLSALILLSQAFALPSPVQNVATGLWESGYQLQFPTLYVLFAPFFMFAETCTLLGVYGSYSLTAWVVFISVLAFGWRRGAAILVLFVLTVAWGALVPKPMARLVSDNPDILLIDFHSHTKASHDGRPSFTPDANRAWHRAQGYHAAFITDHNRTESAHEAKELSRQDWQRSAYASLEGEEISLLKTHLVVLGVHERIDNQPYDSDAAKIPLFIAEMHKQGLLVIASLPEYWLYHWGQGVQDLIRWGIDGFEVVNSAPKALDFPVAKRREILDLCYSHNLFITGISDNHGYGYATAAWNAMRLPGWQKMDPDTLETAVIRGLKTERFRSVTVLERVRFLGARRWSALIAPWMAIILLWRSLTPLLVMSWIAWIWGATFLSSLMAKNSQRRGPMA